MNSIGNYSQRIIVTGGAGFIGSNFLNYMVPRYPDYKFINLDCLTYAGNLTNLLQIENNTNYCFEKIDVRDFHKLSECFDNHKVNAVIHLAAESHVDRSIIGPSDFILTNIEGTFNLLEIARKRMESEEKFRFLHVSTDEVYGSLGKSGSFNENSPYRPNSPYSASKASSDHLVRAYHTTYGLDACITNCSNNYGPYQFPEKLIPLMVRNAKQRKPLPVYGDGKNVRDWLYVEDHCQALDLVFHKGISGETYNIGGNNEIENIELVKKICGIMDEILGGEKHENLIAFIEDRPGHDRRYAIDATYIRNKLGWKPEYNFDTGLRKTIEWYLDNEIWLENCISGEYMNYYEKNYRDR